MEIWYVGFDFSIVESGENKNQKGENDSTSRTGCVGVERIRIWKGIAHDLIS